MPKDLGCASRKLDEIQQRFVDALHETLAEISFSMMEMATACLKLQHENTVMEAEIEEMEETIERLTAMLKEREIWEKKGRVA